jgi:hypothetical protein
MALWCKYFGHIEIFALEGRLIGGSSACGMVVYYPGSMSVRRSWPNVVFFKQPFADMDIVTRVSPLMSFSRLKRQLGC